MQLSHTGGCIQYPEFQIRNHCSRTKTWFSTPNVAVPIFEELITFILHTFYRIYDTRKRTHWWRPKVDRPRELMLSKKTLFATFKHAHESIQFIPNVCIAVRIAVRCTIAKYFNDFIMQFWNIKAGGWWSRERIWAPHEHLLFKSAIAWINVAQHRWNRQFESQAIRVCELIVWCITPSTVR